MNCPVKTNQTFKYNLKMKFEEDLESVAALLNIETKIYVPKIRELYNSYEQGIKSLNEILTRN